MLDLCYSIAVYGLVGGLVGSFYGVSSIFGLFNAE